MSAVSTSVYTVHCTVPLNILFLVMPMLIMVYIPEVSTCMYSVHCTVPLNILFLVMPMLIMVYAWSI